MVVNDFSSIAWFHMTRVELALRLRAIADDLDRGIQSLDGVTVIDRWCPARRTVPCLIGIATGHPTVKDGHPLFSSELFYLDADRGVARSFSRWYKLGQPVEPEFWNHKRKALL